MQGGVGNVVPNASAQNGNNPMRLIGESSSRGRDTENLVSLLSLNNVDPNASAQNANNSPTRIGESSFGQDIENHINFRRLLGDEFWLSRPTNQYGNSRRTEVDFSDEQSFDSLIENISLSELNSFLENNSQNLVDDPVTMEHEPMASSVVLALPCAGSYLNDLNLNSVVEESRTQATQQNSASAAAAGGVQLPITGGSSESEVMIHSGSAGYVIEENMGSENPDPADGNRRLSCKRSAPENASGQSSSGGIASSSQQAANSEPPNAGSLNAATSSGNNLNRSHSARFGPSLSAPPNFNQVSENGIGNARADNFHRSTRMRRARGEENTPANLWTWNSPSNSNILENIPPFSTFPQPSMAMNQGENLRNYRRAGMMPPFFGNMNNGGATMSWGASPSNLAGRENNNFMNNRRDNMQGLLNESFLRSFASSSRLPQTSPLHQPSSSMRPPPQQNVDDAISLALQDLANQSEAWRGLNFCPIHSSSYGVREIDPSVRVGNFRSSSLPPLRFAPRTDRQVLSGLELSPFLLPQPAAQRGRRLISEVRNTLGLVRREDGYHIEEVMVIVPSFFIGLPAFPDLQELLLDVENMSYEEILQLEENMGDVSTGLSDETILANLRRRKYQTITNVPEAEAELCVVCQEEYVDGEELGKVDCGHDFHFNCIMQWLAQKNSCPICKNTALAT